MQSEHVRTTVDVYTEIQYKKVLDTWPIREAKGSSEKTLNQGKSPVYHSIQQPEVVNQVTEGYYSN